MRILRIDDAAQRGATYELHPQLTVLRGLSPQSRSSLIALFRSFVDGGSIEAGGLLEVNGVQLALDRPTIDDLQLAGSPEWIIDWSEPGVPTSIEVRHPGSAVDPNAQNPGTFSGGREVGLVELFDLRQRLRSVAAERTTLGAKMSRVRDRLDSFAHASLEVCVGQIDALEARRSLFRKNWQNGHSDSADLATRLKSELSSLQEECHAVRTLDLSDVERIRDQLANALDAPNGPDPACVELALRIDNALRRLRDQSGRRSSLELRRRETEQRLSEAVAVAAAADRSLRRRAVDPRDVQKLERVRDELFASDARFGRLSVNRNRRRMAELRETEARLLERLGFDTYSAYVMGIPSMKAALEQSAARDDARLAVEQIEQELDLLVREAPSPQMLTASDAELLELLHEASEALGPEMPGPSDLSAGPVAKSFEPTSAATADHVAEVISRLRRHQLRRTEASDPEIREAAHSLRLAVCLIAGDGPDMLRSGPRRFAGVEFETSSWNGTPRDFLAGFDQWIDRLQNTSRWLADTEESIRGLTGRIESLDDAGSAPRVVTEWAGVEAELDVLLDRLVGAQERVRRHEVAMAELAELRDSELELRAEERSLLAGIADVESRLRDRPDDGDESDLTPFERPSDGLSVSHQTDIDKDQTGFNEAARRVDDRTDPDPEWTLLSSLARRRSVSFVGSLPQVILGSPDVRSRDAVFRRVLRFSDLVQMVVICDDEWVGAWAHSLGTAATVIEG